MTMPPTTTPRNTINNGSIKRGQPVQRRFDFLIQKIGHPFQHVVNFAGLLSGGEHADDHDRENGMLGQRGGNALAAFDVHRGGFEGVFHDDVADGVLHDGEHLQNRHAAAHQRGHGAGEARQADFMGDDAEDGQLDPFGVPKGPAHRGADIINPAADNPAHRQQRSG